MKQEQLTELKNLISQLKTSGFQLGVNAMKNETEEEYRDNYLRLTSRMDLIEDSIINLFFNIKEDNKNE